MGPGSNGYLVYLLRAFLQAKAFEPGQVPLPGLVGQKIRKMYISGLLYRPALVGNKSGDSDGDNNNNDNDDNDDNNDDDDTANDSNDSTLPA